jgi:nitrate reductase gamma subunit
MNELTAVILGGITGVMLAIGVIVAIQIVVKRVSDDNTRNS